MRYLLVLLLLASPAYAAKKSHPSKPPEVKEECMKADDFEKLLTEKVSVSDRKDFKGDELEKLRTRIKASHDVPDLPEITDMVQLYKNGPTNYIIALFHKECAQFFARIPVKIFNKVLEDDSL